MWVLALRNVLRHKGRTSITLLSIVAGVVSLILSGGFIHDIIEQFGESLIHSQSGHIQLAKSGYFEHGTRSPEKYLISDSIKLRTGIKGMQGVDDVMGRLYFSGLVNNGRSDQPMIGEGIEPAREAHLGTSLVMVAGRRLQDTDAFGMMIGEGLARKLNLHPGDTATVVTNTLSGAMNSLELRVIGVFETFSKDYDARAVLIPLKAAQELLATHGINTLVISLRHTKDTHALAATLASDYHKAGLEVKSWVELNDFYTNAVKMYQAQFGVLQIIILLMVLLSVVNSVNMTVFERVGEFGTMMALGDRRRKIFSLIVAENSILGLAGAGLGIALGILLALAISAIGIPMPPPPNANLGYTAHIKVVSAVVASAFAIGLVATVLASLIPAARIRTIPVVEALRQNV
jgi:putative ABC transport system permease protein